MIFRKTHRICSTPKIGGLLSDEIGRSVAQSFQYGCAKELEHEILAKRVNGHKIEMIKHPFPRPNALNTGDFTIGFQQGPTQTPILCPFDFMGAPSLICGSTGSGENDDSKVLVPTGGDASTWGHGLLIRVKGKCVYCNRLSKKRECRLRSWMHIP